MVARWRNFESVGRVMMRCRIAITWAVLKQKYNFFKNFVYSKFYYRVCIASFCAADQERVCGR